MGGISGQFDSVKRPVRKLLHVALFKYILS